MVLNSEQIQELLQKQHRYFKEGKTLDVNTRVEWLKKLKACIIDHEKDILYALKEDLGKSETEAFMCEVGLTLSEISYLIKHTKRFAKNGRVKTPLAQFAAKSYVKPSPFGNTLIMSPWNYPFLLTVEPLADAISAGNTAIVKPSAYSPKTSEIVDKIIGEVFPSELACAVTGGRDQNTALLCQKFDFIFFTGSLNVGKEVLRHAAENLTPVVLELGGKSPCIVDKSAKISLAAKRIVFGKFLNCGQTCVAPDYIICHESVKAELISEIRSQIVKQFGEAPLENSSYGKIINKKHFERICSLIDNSKTVIGGETDTKTFRIEPTVMDNVTWEDRVMQEEIFGPVLPVLTFKDTDELMSELSDKPSPLALYVFSENKKNISRIMSGLKFGGGCVNDTIIHLATSEMGFGGVGESGMGRYHGKSGFDAFSYTKSIVDKKMWLDLQMRYQPYTKLGYSLIRRFLK